MVQRKGKRRQVRSNSTLKYNSFHYHNEMHGDNIIFDPSQNISLSLHKKKRWQQIDEWRREAIARDQEGEPRPQGTSLIIEGIGYIPSRDLIPFPSLSNNNNNYNNNNNHEEEEDNNNNYIFLDQISRHSMGNAVEGIKARKKTKQKASKHVRRKRLQNMSKIQRQQRVELLQKERKQQKQQKQYRNQDQNQNNSKNQNYQICLARSELWNTDDAGYVSPAWIIGATGPDHKALKKNKGKRKKAFREILEYKKPLNYYYFK